MTTGQWGVQVPARDGEATRQALLREGALDVTLKVLHEGNDLVFAVLAECDGTGWYEFEEQPGREPLPRH